jgi:4-diphosphocytidyl-2-C-methyl-D-erythritol kinase
MDKISEKAYAKLNLSLDVLGLRGDGYHEMCTVMQSVDFSDGLTVSLRRGGGVSVSNNLPYLPRDERNIAFKAAQVFLDYIGEKDLGADIAIHKRVPVCSGLGGGSGDAAAVLRALNQLTGSGLGAAELEKLGEKLGSDVPFCVAGGTVLAEGRGERLTQIEDFPSCVIVIAKPRFSVSTPQLFARLDKQRTRYHPDTQGLRSCIAAGNLKGACQRVFNVFEEILPSGRDEIAYIKSFLLGNGALGAAMTGTGSAVFGIFEAEGEAPRAAEKLSKQYREVYVTLPQRRLKI